ncbi:MAG: LysR family transcriptional regulator [Ghiorsea sp.]|nr:LysR family transcriptional regulator [Ghiorsea sp.]
MTLEQLKYLQAIVEYGSFRAAANVVFRSQSSLSISIQKLEQELGIKLFARNNYRPELTAEGKAIYTKSQELLNKSNDLKNLAEHLASGFEAELRLAISGILPIEPILKVLNTLDDTYPETRMNISVENLSGTIERLLDDDVDIALTDSLDPDAHLEILELTRVDFVSVVPSQSGWANKADVLTEQDLEHETMIVVRDTSHHSERISKGILEGAPQWVVNDFSTKQRIICSGKGWGRMPLHLVVDDIQQGRLALLTSPDFQSFKAHVYLVRKKNRPIGKVEGKLWQALQDITW